VSAERSLPLQGGLPPAPGMDRATIVEVACDESGSSGSNLLDAATPIFTHASVDLSVAEAVELVEVLQARSGRPLSELKSGQLLRAPGSGETLQRLLVALRGRAHVLLVDKEYFLCTRVVDLFLAEPTYAAGTRLTEAQRPAALAVYRAGRSAGSEGAAFLAAFVDLVRTKHRARLEQRVLERFFRARDALARSGAGKQAEAVLEGLTRTRVRAVVTRLHQDDRAIPPPLEPLLPALAETVLFWGRGGRQVLVVHDEQSALTADRLRRLQDVLADGAPGPRASPLAGLVTVDSRDDPRVQVADLLAGVARRLASGGTTGPLGGFLSVTSLRDPAG